MNLNFFKKTAFAAVISTSLMFGAVTPATAGIPVTNPLGLVQQIQQTVQMAQQIQNQIKQLTELKNQLKAVTGSRNMGNLLKDTAKSQIPTEWSSLYNGIKDIDYKSVLDGKKYNPETALQLLASNEELTKKAFDELYAQLTTVEKLREEINNTQDIKAAADLQNRIATEQAKIQTTQARLDMMDRFFAQQEKIEKKKYAAREACMSRHMFDKKFDECNR
ncbi:hypothetical protein AKG09_01900 [Neisseria sp. 83E34]|nr:hypothetical protein AKG09_01900 [Neisseria sp. 83E34]